MKNSNVITSKDLLASMNSLDLPRNQTRRKFLKKSGSATVASLLAYGLSQENARAEGHDPASCSHAVIGTPAGSNVNSPALPYASGSGNTVQVIFNSTPVSGEGKTVYVYAQIQKNVNGAPAAYGSQVHIKGWVRPEANCSFSCDWSGGASPILTSSLPLTTITAPNTEYRRYAVLQMTVSEDYTTGSEHVKAEGTLTITEQVWVLTDTNPDPHIETWSWVKTGESNIASDSIAMRISKK